MNRQIRRTVVVGKESVAKEEVEEEVEVEVEVEEEEVVAAAAVSAVDQNTKSYVRGGKPKS
jgi:hypothetical protein